MWLTYIIIAVLLLAAELIYFRIADKCNIIDKPNERSSHSTIVLRGGGIIFAISMVIWSLTPFPSPMGEGSTTLGIVEYWPFVVGLVLVCGVSFVDDIHSLPVNHSGSRFRVQGSRCSMATRPGLVLASCYCGHCAVLLRGGYEHYQLHGWD